MRKILPIVLICCCLLVIDGCSSGRRASQPAVSVAVGGSTESRFASIAEVCDDWECVAVPVRFELRKPASVSFSGKAYFIRGKEVFISLRKFGFEVAQLSLTPDSVLLMDKFNNRHVAENISSMIKGAPVGISDLQALLLAQPFMAGGKLVPEKFSFVDRDGEWYAIPRDEEAPFAAAFSFSTENNMMVSAATRLFTVTYRGTDYYGKMILPENENVKVDEEKIKIDVVIKYNWKDAVWNSPEDIRHVKQPSPRSRRLDTGSLLKNLGI